MPEFSDESIGFMNQFSKFDFSGFPEVHRNYKNGDPVHIKNDKGIELDFAVAVADSTKAMESVKSLYLEHDNTMKMLIKKYRKNNPQVEDVLFTRTAKHDLNAYIALGVALYCIENKQLNILEEIVRKTYKKMFEVSSEQDAYFADEYIRKLVLNTKNQLVVDTRVILQCTSAVNFMEKVGKEFYIIDQNLQGVYGVAMYPLYSLKVHREEAKDNRNQIKKMKTMLGLEDVQPNQSTTITKIAFNNSYVRESEYESISFQDSIIKSYFSQYGDFADLMGIDSHLVNNYEIKGSDVTDAVYYVLVSLHTLDINMKYKQSDYFMMFFSTLYLMVLSKIFKSAKDELIINSDMEISKRIATVKKEGKATINQLTKELSIAKKENGRLQGLVESATKEDKIQKLNLKELRKQVEEIERLKFENKVLKETIDQNKKMSETSNSQISSAERIEYLKAHEILLVGGHVNFQNKLKEILPNIKTFDIDENNTKTLTNINGNDVIFLFTDYLNHGLFNRVTKELNDKSKIKYLDSHVNLDLVIEQMYLAMNIN